MTIVILRGGNYLSRWLHTQDYLRQKLSPFLVKKIWPYLHIHFKAPLIRNESIFVLLIEKIIIQGLVFDFPFIYQIYFIMTALVKSACWNPAELLIAKSFHQHFILFWYGVLLKREMQLLLPSLFWYSEILSQMITFNHFSYQFSYFCSCK